MAVVATPGVTRCAVTPEMFTTRAWSLRRRCGRAAWTTCSAPTHLGVEPLAQGLGAELGNRAAAEAAGIVDHGVESAMPLDDLGDHPADLSLVRDVAQMPAAPLATQCIDCVATGEGVTPHHGDDGPLGYRRLRHRPSDTAVGSGDQDHAFTKVQIHDRAPPPVAGLCTLKAAPINNQPDNAAPQHFLCSAQENSIELGRLRREDVEQSPVTGWRGVAASVPSVAGQE